MAAALNTIGDGLSFAFQIAMLNAVLTLVGVALLWLTVRPAFADRCAA